MSAGYQTITLCTNLNMLQFFCQLHVSKGGGGGKEGIVVTTTVLPFLSVLAFNERIQLLLQE